MSQSGSITVTGAGVFAYTFTPSKTPPPPQGLAVTAPGTIAPGATVTAHITGPPTLAAVEIVAVQAQPPNYPFYPPQKGVGPFDNVPLTAGTGTYAWTPEGQNDFLKFGPVGGPYTDTPGVTITQPVGPPPTGGLAAAQAWAALAKRGRGINVERSRPFSLTWDGQPLATSSTWPAQAKTLWSYVRGFFGWSPGHDVIGLGRTPTVADYQPYFAWIQAMTAAGMPVRFDFFDGTDASTAGQILTLLDQVAASAAAFGFTHPELIVFGAVNEPIDDGAGGAVWTPILEQMATILRKHLPASTWTLAMLHNYWDALSTLSQEPPEPDQRWIAPVHYYPNSRIDQNGAASVSAEWATVASGCAAWEAAHGGSPTILDECGLWNENDGGTVPSQSWWAQAIPLMPKGAAPWALTDGGDGNAPPVNVGNSNGSAGLDAATTAAFAAAL